ncbi:hypothetical protein RI129_001379 [Pyrocoelia pectoralis]|uniref:Transmembrane protein n=1 Tax=Pyrocoelia pectoralis TaxID=417401 RepID=A0AAN7VJJ0_9COLE
METINMVAPITVYEHIEKILYAIPILLAIHFFCYAFIIAACSTSNVEFFQNLINMEKEEDVIVVEQRKQYVIAKWEEKDKPKDEEEDDDSTWDKCDDYTTNCSSTPP